MRDIDAWLYSVRRATGRKQQMETAFVNVADISRLDTFEVRKWSGLPGSRVHLGEVHEGKLNDEPQGIPTVKFRHLPRTGWFQVWNETLLGPTSCIFPIPSMVV